MGVAVLAGAAVALVGAAVASVFLPGRSAVHTVSTANDPTIEPAPNGLPEAA
jgi:hypothetical protein